MHRRDANTLVGWSLDSEIARLVKLLNDLPGVRTVCSCSGHPQRDPLVTPFPFIDIRRSDNRYLHSVERLIGAVRERGVPFSSCVTIKPELGTDGHRIEITPHQGFDAVVKTWSALESVVECLLAEGDPS